MAEPFVGIAPRLHAERVLLAGWGRAILLQLAHPKVAQGVLEHSHFAATPGGRIRRLRRTLDAMLALTFGTPADADRVARGIRGIHDRVHGTLGASAGGFAAGAPYSARDPALLGWVHATLLDSFLVTYELFVARLSEAERDRYCAESTVIGPLLGISARWLPTSAAQLRDVLAERLASGEIAVTDAARRVAREVVHPPAPWIAGPALAAARLVTTGLLPPPIREAYGLPWSDRRAAVLRALAAASRRALPWTPSTLRHWGVARAARARWSAKARASRSALTRT